MKWTEDLTKESTKQSRQESCGLVSQSCQEQKRSTQKCKDSKKPILTLGKLLTATLILSSFSPIAKAEINPTQAQKAIIGEAADQGFHGMVGVAEVIRRRGNLKGLYGLKRESFISSQPKWVHDMAKKAWEESSKSNLTKGATHFENVKAFGVPSWAKSMTKTATIKDHTFYREEK